MSLIRIRGRTILSPILSESERLEARALRDQAVRSQHHRHKGHSHSSGRGTSSTTERVSSAASSTPCPKSRTHGDTSSSSAPSSHGDGGDAPTGPEDSPSTANASVQTNSSVTNSSVSLTASTDLRPYLNTSLDTSLDTSTSVSLNNRHHKPSMAPVDEALLLMVSPEIATDLILGRVDPSTIVRPASLHPDSQRSDTPATITRHTTKPSSDTHDTTVSLSLASCSEEGGSECLEATEDILETLEGWEEDKDTSVPSEAESDWHREETDGSGRLTRGSGSSVELPRDLRVSALRSDSSRRDSGRGSSHSDYLNDYLDLLTSRTSSGLGLQTTVVAASKMTAPVTTTSSTRGVVTTSAERADPRKASVRQDIRENKENEERTNMPQSHTHSSNSKEATVITQAKAKDIPAKVYKDRRVLARVQEEEGRGKKTIKDKDWSREGVEAPRAASVASERRPSKRSRERRLSSQSDDSTRSKGSKYLDSYLGNITDDAWLRYPFNWGSQNLVFLDPETYMPPGHTPKSRRRPQSHSSTDHTESSTSEDGRCRDSSSSYSPQGREGGERYKGRDGRHGLWPVSPRDRKRRSPSREQYCSAAIQTISSEELDQEEALTKWLNDSSSYKAMERVPKSVQTCEKIPEVFSPSQEDNIPTVITQEKEHRPPAPSPAQIEIQPGAMERSLPLPTIPDVSPRTPGLVTTEELTEESEPTKNDDSKDDNDNKIDVADPEFKVAGLVECEDQEEVAAPALKVASLVEGGEPGEGAEDSSSDESSETEPSTIVYVDDPSLEVQDLQHKETNKTDTSSESDQDRAMTMKDKEVTDRGMPTSKSLTEFEQLERSQEIDDRFSPVRSDETMDDEDSAKTPENYSNSPDNDTPNGSVKEMPRVSSATDSPLTLSDQSPDLGQPMGHVDTPPLDLNDNHRSVDKTCQQTEPKLEIYNTDEECLVVQVTEVDKEDMKKTPDSRNEEEVVEIVASNADQPGTELELASSSGRRDLVPEKVTEDAMSQMLSLLRAKQRREAEELRQRQEEEVRQFIQQLQRVPPKRLQAFLAANTITCPTIEGPNDEQIVPNPGKDLAIEGHHGTHTAIYDKHDDGSSDEKGRTLNERYLVQSKGVQDMANTDGYPMVHPRSSALPTTAPMPSRRTEHIKGEQQPRPSNHTNLMPSYFVNEEMQRSDDSLENIVTSGGERHHLMVGGETTHLNTSPHHYPSTSPEPGREGPLGLNNNNHVPMEALSIINGNVSYGDGMQYYRLFTADEEARTSPRPPHNSSRHPPVLEPVFNSSRMVTGPGLFRVVSGSPWPTVRPTSITSLISQHPEMFNDEVVEVNLHHVDDWGNMERRETPGRRETHGTSKRECLSPRPSLSPRSSLTPRPNLSPRTSLSPRPSAPQVTRVPHHIPQRISLESCRRQSSEEGGLDMVPERESAASVHRHPLSQDMIFICGLTRLQACVRRYLTQRLFRTRFVQEQLGILAEIAKLARQFHRDILTDNIQKGDVDFHKALYNQEGMARERIRRVFVVLTVQEQMSLIRRDRQLSLNAQLSPSQTKGTRGRTAPQETGARTTPTRVAKKRPSPPQGRGQQEAKTRVSPQVHRTSHLTQPSVISQPMHTSGRTCLSSEHRSSPRVTRAPIERSSSHLGSPITHHYRQPIGHSRSPSHETRAAVHTPSRCSVHPRSTTHMDNRSGVMSRSTSNLPATHQVTKVSSASTKPHQRNSGISTSRSGCSMRTATNSNSPRRVTPPRSATKTCVSGRRPWR